MSATGQNNHQLQADLQQELITANQLLNIISIELKRIQNFTSAGGELESNIINNAALISKLADIQNVDLEKVPQMIRRHIDMNTLTNHNKQHTTPMNESEMEDSQMT